MRTAVCENHQFRLQDALPILCFPSEIQLGLLVPPHHFLSCWRKATTGQGPGGLPQPSAPSALPLALGARVGAAGTAGLEQTWPGRGCMLGANLEVSACALLFTGGGEGGHCPSLSATSHAPEACQHGPPQSLLTLFWEVVVGKKGRGEPHCQDSHAPGGLPRVQPSCPLALSCTRAGVSSVPTVTGPLPSSLRKKLLPAARLAGASAKPPASRNWSLSVPCQTVARWGQEGFTGLSSPRLGQEALSVFCL